MDEEMAQAILDAIKDGDAAALADAFVVACDACMSEDEADEDKNMPAVMIGMARKRK